MSSTSNRRRGCIEGPVSGPDAKNPHARNQHDWEVIASRDPWFGVLTADEFRSDRIDDAARQRFFQTGKDNMDVVLGWFDEQGVPPAGRISRRSELITALARLLSVEARWRVRRPCAVPASCSNAAGCQSHPRMSLRPVGLGSWTPAVASKMSMRRSSYVIGRRSSCCR